MALNVNHAPKAAEDSAWGPGGLTPLTRPEGMSTHDLQVRRSLSHKTLSTQGAGLSVLWLQSKYLSTLVAGTGNAQVATIRGNSPLSGFTFTYLLENKGL